MKKFPKVLLVSLVSLQTLMATPLTILANEQGTKGTIKQEKTSKDKGEEEEDSEDKQPTETSSSETSESTTTTESSSTSSTNSGSSTTSETSTVTSDKEVSSSESSQESTTSTSNDHSTSTSQSNNGTTTSSENPKNEPSDPTAIPPQEESETLTESPVDSQATADLERVVPSGSIQKNGSIHFEKNESVESFIRKIGESSRKIGKERDLYASVMVAQAVLESASGQSSLAQAPNYNLFGIKGSHKGKTVALSTQEDAGNGALYSTEAGFRVYENYEESLNDYADLLSEGISGNSNYYEGVWKSKAPTYQEATAYLTGRYATDTQYDQKLNGLIETYKLTEYDKEIQGPPTGEVNASGYAVPVANYSISSPFGIRGGEFHRGLDMAASQGEPIHASKAGTVVKAEFHPSWGNHVVIQHEDGMTSLYAHQQEYVVHAGDQVKQGQLIGYVGSTGNSSGAHLHLEICRDNSLSQDQLVDPASIIF